MLDTPVSSAWHEHILKVLRLNRLLRAQRWHVHFS